MRNPTKEYPTKADMQRLRDAILNYVRLAQQAVGTKRPSVIGIAFDETIPEARDDCFCGWGTEDQYKILDACMDGYIVETRQPLDKLRNRWVLQKIPNDADIYLTWINEDLNTTTALDDGLEVQVYGEINSISDDLLHKYGGWPIREGFIDIPDRSLFVER